MMGNVLIAAATLIYIGMLILIYNPDYLSGEQGMAVGLLLVIGNFVFVVCLAVVTGKIGSSGGFSWIGSDDTPRFIIILAGFIVAIAGHLYFFFGGGMDYLPPFVRQVFKFVPVLIPLLLLVSVAILYNENWRLAAPGMAYKLPITIALAFGIFAVGLIIMDISRKAGERVQAKADYEDWNYQNWLNTIDSCNVMKEMVIILPYTDANHYPEVRKRALAKIKTRPDWQEELVRRIKTDWAPDVFTFLASNEVEDKTLFPEAIKEGILIQANLMRKDIRSAVYSSHLTHDEFYRKVQRALQTADKFSEMGTDYRPAVEEMLRALDEPCRIEKPNFRSKPLLEEWLKKHH